MQPERTDFHVLLFVASGAFISAWFRT
jgi:hypothetical protein